MVVLHTKYLQLRNNKMYYVYVDTGFSCEHFEVPEGVSVKELASKWFLEQLQKEDSEIHFHIEEEE